MSKNIAANAALYLNGREVTGSVRQAAPAFRRELAQVTGMNSPGRRFVPGPARDEIRVIGLFDSAHGNIWEALNAHRSNDAVVTLAFNRVVQNSPAVFGGGVKAPGMSAPLDIGGAVGLRATLRVDGRPFDAGVLLAPKATRAGPFHNAGIDQAAAACGGGAAALQVLAFTGASATVSVQDSPDGAAWGDLLAFSPITGVTAERAAVPGNVNRYVRAVLSGTFSSITYLVSWSRG